MFTTIRICNINFIWWSNLEKMAKNLVCAYLDHSKRHFLWLLNDPTRVITWTNHVDYLVLSEFAVSSQSDATNSRKWPKTSFLAIWIIQKGIFVLFEWSIMTGTMAKSCRPFSSIKICNINSIRWTKLKKMTKNLIFGCLDHCKRHFCDFWMIQHGRYDNPLVKII